MSLGVGPGPLVPRQMVKRSAASGPGLQSCMDYAGKEVPSHPPPPSLATGPRRLELPSQLKPFAELARMDKPIGALRGWGAWLRR